MAKQYKVRFEEMESIEESEIVESEPNFSEIPNSYGIYDGSATEQSESEDNLSDNEP
jgi:hypothetical protein